MQVDDVASVKISVSRFLETQIERQSVPARTGRYEITRNAASRNSREMINEHRSGRVNGNPQFDQNGPIRRGKPVESIASI